MSAFICLWDVQLSQFTSCYCIYTCDFLNRLQLAALHFNENTNRVQAVTKQGTRRYDVVFPKYKKGGYVVKKVLTNATYGKVQNEA